MHPLERQIPRTKEAPVDNHCKAGWTLVIGAFLLLAVMGKLDLLMFLIPASLLLGCGLLWLGGSKTGLTGGGKKG
jgi:hypothetical protein